MRVAVKDEDRAILGSRKVNTNRWKSQSLSSMVRIVVDRGRWAAMTTEASVGVAQRCCDDVCDSFIHSFVVIEMLVPNEVGGCGIRSSSFKTHLKTLLST